ncbi:MAG: DUF3027 domain-containing protein [Candidatus Nanopelagicales bacterium]|nr:DUF3027 domain-containing protein [Candidatus Nanopelagicales bacterium]
MDEPTEDLLVVVVGDATHPQEEQVVAPTAEPEQPWEIDEICAQAVDLARAALVEEASEEVVGEHVGLVADGPLVVTHFFRGSVPGYAGWQWAVSVTRAPDSDHVTIDETALLPDGDALLAPAWVPWKQRIESGDLGTGDVMVTEPDDPRLVPGMADSDLPESEDALMPAQWELGLGRVRILSPQGRRDAAARWYREAGPRASAVRSTGLQCATCGFLVMIGGPLGQGFGICANGYSPADGRAVALNFGCGAHSEMPAAASVQVAETVIDEIGFDDLGQVEAEPDVPTETPTDTATDTATETPAEVRDSEAPAPDVQAGVDEPAPPEPEENVAVVEAAPEEDQ